MGAYMALKIDDEVCFLYYSELHTGNIKEISLNDNLFGIEVESGEVLYCNRKYVVPIESKFCIVNQDPTFSYKPQLRFDFTTYPSRNRTWDNWTNPESWIKEFFDPYELKNKATVYGLEI